MTTLTGSAEQLLGRGAQCRTLDRLAADVLPLLEGLAVLPAPQRAALETVFGLSSGPAPDRFLVRLATLSLMAEAARAQPLIAQSAEVAAATGTRMTAYSALHLRSLQGAASNSSTSSHPRKFARPGCIRTAPSGLTCAITPQTGFAASWGGTEHAHTGTRATDGFDGGS